jgi:hypothetical protein
MVELHNAIVVESHAARCSIPEFALASYRHILNTKRDHLISITHVNDTLISELISSGVISAESDFTEIGVRWTQIHINHFY